MQSAQAPVLRSESTGLSEVTSQIVGADFEPQKDPRGLNRPGGQGRVKSTQLRGQDASVFSATISVFLFQSL